MLQISRVQQEDGGKYTCQAVNEAGEDHMHFELEILGKQGCLLSLFKICSVQFLDGINDTFILVFHLRSPSCYYGSIRVYGGNGSSCQQHCGFTL